MNRSLFNRFSALIFSAAIFLLSKQAVLAVSIPSFPSCSSPQGAVRVRYDNGTHGIVGSSATYTGSDTVYKLNDDQITQCFCGENGSGIQTDWWRANNLDSVAINTLISQGWFYVPNGSVWGLTSDQYVARNTSLSCTSSSVLSEASTGTGGAYEQGGEVLGLAATGNSRKIVGVFLLGLGLVFFGLARSRKKRS